jgi:signal transduction histidine kinase
MSEPATPLRSFRRAQATAVLLPIGLLSLLALTLGWEIRMLLNASADATRSARVVALAEKARELLVDQETGLRGYLLTGDRIFLEPLEKARRDLRPLGDQLATILRSDPEQTARLREAIRHVGDWEAFADTQLDQAHRGVRGKPSEILHDQRFGKQIMDAVRAAADRLIQAEADRATARDVSARTLGRRVLFGSTVWALAVGVVLAAFSRMHFKSLAGQYEAALAEATRQAEAAHEAARQTQALNVTLEQRVAERTAALEATNVELEAFSYSVSHDLRAPVRHVAGFVQMLTRSALPKMNEKERHYIETIRSSAEEAGRLIDDLLSFARMTRLELQWHPVDMGALARDARELVSREARGREVRWNIAPLPTVRGDREMLRLVFDNLFSNALKYTRGRSPATIDVGSERRDDGSVVFFVRDNGVGFDMRYASKLFGVFQRLHRSDEFEGTGIGLANVRRIVLRHGGRVWAEAALGRGATFYFTLPPQHGPAHPGPQGELGGPHPWRAGEARP